MKKKLLFITDRNTHGGSMKMFVWLANTMAEFYEVWYCNLSTERPFYELNTKIKFIETKHSNNDSFIYRNTIGFFQNIKALIDIIKKQQIDTIVNFADHVLYSLVIAKKLIKFKLLLSQRIDPFSCKKKADLFRHHLYRYADGLVCQTESAQDYFNKARYRHLKKKVIYNPSFGSTKLCWNKQEHEGYIISLARIDLKQKRQDLLIEAMKMVHEKYPHIKLRFYGADVDASVEKLKNMIQQNQLEDTAFYCGVTDHVYGVLCKARMLVLTSDYEGIPNAIIEAMELGLPVISTDCKPGGARLLIDTEDKGTVVERDNSLRLAEAILYYIEHEDIAAEHGQNAKDSLSRFSEENIALQWKNLIDEI
ncbi:MAG: glycosyltransferase family 4 protein [Lachnospiraceae bacterium]|nr:glycosyltransferase family 4 protein [Lachnospiraceae bacterium]